MDFVAEVVGPAVTPRLLLAVGISPFLTQARMLRQETPSIIAAPDVTIPDVTT